MQRHLNKQVWEIIILRRLTLIIVVSLFIVQLFTAAAQAALTTQNITLKPGWNAVFLEVQPQSTNPATVFNLINNLESVWMWNPQTSTVEFIQDPTMPVPQGSTWLVYYPADPILTNLHAIQGETAYLIKLGGSVDVNWTVTGEPAIPHIDWKPNSFNFVGFHLAPGQEPFFDEFFSSSAAHTGQDIYILNNTSGNWEKVTEPLTTTMLRGEAFWIFCHGYSEFTGPLSVQLEQFSGLHYGTTLQEQSLMFRNNSAAAKNVSLSLSALNNTVYYWVFDPAQQEAGWTPFPSPLELQVPAGDKQNLRLGVKRVGLTADTTYEANMTVTDGQGIEILLPVSVTGISYSGLRVGDATITEVNQPSNGSDPDTPVSTGSEFSFRLIMHADDTGTVRLLSQVIQMWQEGTWMPDPNDLGKQIVDQPGYFVLFADDALIPNYSGSAMRDGQLVGRRISSTAFPSLTLVDGAMDGEAVPGGDFDPAPDNDLSVPDTDLHIQLTIAQDDPTNPFRHMFNPDHKDPAQSYEVVRDIIFTFSDVDTAGIPITGVPSLSWGSSEIGGIYNETITGLHKDTLKIKGTFLLRKVSEIETLEVAQ